MRSAAVGFFLISIWASAVLTSQIALAARSPTLEFVVPGGPSITFQDGQRIDGHIIDFDQTNVVILTLEGVEQTLPRAAIDRVQFETVTGEEVTGALLGWQPGVYELTTEEAVVTVYSVAPRRAAGGAGVPVASDSVVNDGTETTVAVNAERDAGDAGDNRGRGIDAAADIETEVAAATPSSDLQIDVSADSSREGGGPVGFDIELSRPSENSVVLIYATIDDTAIGGEDYETARGVLVIKAGQTNARIEAPVIDDKVSEGEESLRLFLTVDPNVAAVNNREIIAFIEDDD